VGNFPRPLPGRIQRTLTEPLLVLRALLAFPVGTVGTGRPAAGLRRSGAAPAGPVGAVTTGAVDGAWQVQWTEEERQQSIDNALLRRRCTIDDIAEAIVFLSCAAAMATGQMLVVDGGLNL